MTTPKTYWFHIYRGYRGFLQSVVQPNYYNERGVVIDMKIDISIFKPSKSIITIPYNGYIVENFKRYDSLDIYDSDNKLVYSGHPTRYHWTQNKNSDIIKINLEPYWKNMSLKLSGRTHEYFDDLYELYNGKTTFDVGKRYSEKDYISYGNDTINLKNTWITTIQIPDPYARLIDNGKTINNTFKGNNGYEILKNFIDYEYYKDEHRNIIMRNDNNKMWMLTCREKEPLSEIPAIQISSFPLLTGLVDVRVKIGDNDWEVYNERTTNLNNDDFEMEFNLSDMLAALLSSIYYHYPNYYYRGFFGSIRSFNTTITDTSTPAAQHPTLTIDYNTHNDTINIKSKGGFYQTFTVYKLLNDLTNNRFNNMTNTYEIPEMIFSYTRPKKNNSKTLIVLGNRKVFDKYMNYNYNGYGIISKRDLVEYEDRKESNQLAEVGVGYIRDTNFIFVNMGKVGVYDNGTELRRYHKFSITNKTIKIYNNPNLTTELDSFETLTSLGFINNYFTPFNLNNEIQLGDRTFNFTIGLTDAHLRYGNVGILNILSSDRTWYKYNGMIGAKLLNPGRHDQNNIYSTLYYPESTFTKLENFLIEKRNILKARLKLKEQYISPLPLLFNSKIELIDEQGVSKKGLITSISTTDKDPRLNLILRDYKYKTTDYIDLNEKGENDDIY